MAGNGATTSEDEVVPIRQAGEGRSRNYDTNTPPQASRTADRGPDVTVDAATPVDAAPAVRDGLDRNNGQADTDKVKSTWLKDIAERYGSITLENKGSVARDHLALERTFLAWLRTSLAFASIGIAITQLFRLNTSLSQRAHAAMPSSMTNANTLPYSPFVGHSIPAELAPYLQDVLASSSLSTKPDLGPTLFDQLFGLTADGEIISTGGTVHTSIEGNQYHTEASNSKIRHLGKPLGSTFIGVSIIILLVGFHRYFESQYWIIKGKFPASRGSVAFVGLLTAALIVTCLVVIVVVDPTSYERKKR